MHIRQATQEDAHAIAALHAASWRSTYADELDESYLARSVPAERLEVWSTRLRTPRANQRVLVAELKASIVGFACAYINEHSHWGNYLDNLHVDALQHGRGIGAALLNRVATTCQAEGASGGLYLYVNQTNLLAQQFYLKFGAHSAEAGIWNAPDGTKVPTFRFAWHSISGLIANA